MKRDLVSFATWTAEEIRELLSLSTAMRDGTVAEGKPLDRKTAVLVFERESLRTRVSFEVGIAELGGHAIFLQNETIGIATRESVHDIAATLSEYCSLIIARTVRHHACLQLAESASIPVINALTDVLHPCQVLADLFTLMDRGRFGPATKIAYVGNGNNIANSWLELASKLPMHLVCSCPSGYEPLARFVEDAQASGVSRVELVADPMEAVAGAGVIYTDVWPRSSAGPEEAMPVPAFRAYQVNKKLVKHAAPSCLVMHRLPANRGEEITSEVLDGRQSVVLEQAHNRLHVQKAVMAWLLKTNASRL